MTPTDLSAILAVLVAMISVVMNIRKAPKELREIDARSQKTLAETVLSYQTALRGAADQINDLIVRVDGLETKLNQQEKVIQEQILKLSHQEKVIQEQGATITRMEDENARLLAQVDALTRRRGSK